MPHTNTSILFKYVNGNRFCAVIIIENNYNRTRGVRLENHLYGISMNVWERVWGEGVQGEGVVSIKTPPFFMVGNWLVHEHEDEVT